MKRVIYTLMVLLVAGGLSGCGTARAVSVDELPPVADPITGAAGAPGGGIGLVEREVSGDAGIVGSAGDVQDRIVIKNADLSIVVADPAQCMEIITNLAEGMGGFVVSSNLYKVSTDNGMMVPQAKITVRVPAERLNDALTQIKALVEDPKVDILYENISGTDVTSEYTDLQSRLRNLETAEEQLTEIMKSATDTEDVIYIYNQIMSVREQIEVIKGQLQYYDQSSKYSAISVTLKAQESIAPLTIGGWQPVGVARDAIQAMLKGLKIIVNVVIWVILFILPLLLVLGLLIYLPIRFIIWLVRRSKAHRKAKRAESPTTVMEPKIPDQDPKIKK